MARAGGRLGLGFLVRDHLQTLYVFGSKEGSRRTSALDWAIFYVTPSLLAAGLWLGRLRLYGTQSLIGGVAILTGLLFGLLIHVFTLGLKVGDDDRFTTGSRVAILVDELRANVSYACAVGLLLTAVLTAGAAVSKESDTEGLPIAVGAIAAALFLHLMLTLLMILKRIRTSYKLLAK